MDKPRIYEVEPVGRYTTESVKDQADFATKLFITEETFKPGDLIVGDMMVVWFDAAIGFSGDEHFAFLTDANEDTLNDWSRVLLGRDADVHGEGTEGWRDFNGGASYRHVFRVK